MSTSRESDLNLELRGLVGNQGLERGSVHSLHTVRVSYRIQNSAQLTAPGKSQACWENGAESGAQDILEVGQSFRGEDTPPAALHELISAPF